jgi:Cu2+-exporting ATPase
MGAYALIHEMGLEDYYKLRADTGSALGVQESEQRNAVLFDLDAAGVKVNHLPGGLDCVRLSVEGMHCAACSWLIERLQPTIHGLYSARVRLSDNSVELIYDPLQTTVARVASRLSKIGYQLAPWQDDEEQAREVTLKQREHWIGLAVAAFLAANAMWIGVALYAGEATGISKENEYFLRWVGAVLGLLAAIFPGQIFFQTAWAAIKSKTPHIDIPVAIALLIGSASAVYGAYTGVGHVYFDSLASFVLLLRVGRYLQFRAQSRARVSMTRLLRWHANIAKKKGPDDVITVVPSSRLKPGDVAVVEPGEIVPADGEILTGKSAIDMSLLTGETQPVMVESGDVVVGGTTNLTSRVEMLVSAAGDESRMGKLMAMVRDATTYRTPWIQAADKVSRWFVVIVLALAVLTFAGWSVAASVGTATGHTIALLTIACPCALALAAPLVVTISLGRAARQQIWVREGECLEKLAKPGMLWLDKTGTITMGRMHVHRWIGDEKWLPAIAALERSVYHPIASAIVDFSEAYEAEVHGVDYGSANASEVVQQQGLGVRGLLRGGSIDEAILSVGSEAWIRRLGIPITESWRVQAMEIVEKGQSAIWVASDDHVVGLFAVGDAIRHDAVDTLRALRELGWKLGILSGDHPKVVEKIAESLRNQGVELETVLGAQNPEDKLAMVRNSREQLGIQIAMVGDGVNDAAALAAADIGIAVRGNTEQSLAAAPIYIANPRLSSLLELFLASKRVVRAIRNCFVVSLLYNTITLSLAISGLIHPLTAALFMPLSGVSVLVLAMNARTFTKRREKTKGK